MVNSDRNIGEGWKKWTTKFKKLLKAMDIRNDTKMPWCHINLGMKYLNI